MTPAELHCFKFSLANHFAYERVQYLIGLDLSLSDDHRLRELESEAGRLWLNLTPIQKSACKQPGTED